MKRMNFSVLILAVSTVVILAGAIVGYRLYQNHLSFGLKQTLRADAISTTTGHNSDIHVMIHDALTQVHTKKDAEVEGKFQEAAILYWHSAELSDQIVKDLQNQIDRIQQNKARTANLAGWSVKAINLETRHIYTREEPD